MIIIYILLPLFIIVFGWIAYQKTIKELYTPSKNMQNVLPSILTYNIQKFPWSFKTLKTIAEMDNHSIILIQECYDELFSSLESYFPHYYICRSKMKGITIVNSGLVILSKYPIIDYKFVPYVNYNAKTLDCLTEKGFLTATMDVNGKPLTVINTHLQSCDHERYDQHAFLQLKELLKYVEKLDTYIIGGDFNIDIEDLKTRHRLQVFYPSDPTIYIDFKTSKSQSSPAKGYEGLVFDYFITGGNLRMDPVTIQSPYSDHNPVSSKIDLEF